jgi:hypothetical protein
VHDGLRSGADAAEKISHSRTRNLIQLKCFPEKVKKITFEENLGTTLHLFRVAKIVLEECDHFVIHEDDKVSNTETFEILRELSASNSTPQYFDTRGPQVHRWFDSRWRSALSSLNGVGLINRPLLFSAEEDYRKGKFWERSILRNLNDFYASLPFSTKHKHRIITTLSKRLSFGLSNPNRTDALLIYSLLLRKQLKFVTNRDYSYDISDLDFRGLNQNYFETRNLQLCRDISLRKSSLGMICQSCEVLGTHNSLPIFLRQRISSQAKFHFGKLFAFGDGRKANLRRRDKLQRNFDGTNLEAFLNETFRV